MRTAAASVRAADVSGVTVAGWASGAAAREMGGVAATGEWRCDYRSLITPHHYRGEHEALPVVVKRERNAT